MTLFDARFQGRTAIITGGASGVGFDVPKRIVAEGGVVALWDRDNNALAIAKSSLPSAIVFQVDVTNYGQVEDTKKSPLWCAGLQATRQPSVQQPYSISLAAGAPIKTAAPQSRFSVSGGYPNSTPDGN